jgi:hypothetical protein
MTTVFTLIVSYQVIIFLSLSSLRDRPIQIGIFKHNSKHVRRTIIDILIHRPSVFNYRRKSSRTGLLKPDVAGRHALNFDCNNCTYKVLFINSAVVFDLIYDRRDHMKVSRLDLGYHVAVGQSTTTCRRINKKINSACLMTDGLDRSIISSLVWTYGVCENRHRVKLDCLHRSMQVEGAVQRSDQ